MPYLYLYRLLISLLLLVLSPINILADDSFFFDVEVKILQEDGSESGTPEVVRPGETRKVQISFSTNETISTARDFYVDFTRWDSELNPGLNQQPQESCSSKASPEARFDPVDLTTFPNFYRYSLECNILVPATAKLGHRNVSAAIEFTGDGEKLWGMGAMVKPESVDCEEQNSSFQCVSPSSNVQAVLDSLDPGGLIYLEAGSYDIDSISSNGVLRINKEVTLLGPDGSSQDVEIIRSAGSARQGRLLEIRHDDVSLINIALRGGDTNHSSSPADEHEAGWGGAAIVDPQVGAQNGVEFINVRMENNQASRCGGALASKSISSLIVWESDILSNTTLSGSGTDYLGGGGICGEDLDSVLIGFANETNSNFASSGGALALKNFAYLLIQNSSINLNSASLGGALFLESDTAVDVDGIPGPDFPGYTAINTSQIVSNSANWGAGLHYLSAGTELSIADTNIQSNVANRDGGGIFVQGQAKIDIMPNNFLTLADIPVSTCGGYETAFRSNRANGDVDYGGAIWAHDVAELNIYGVEFNANYSDSLGGAIYIEDVPSSRIYYSKFISNTAHSSGAAISSLNSSLEVYLNNFFSNNLTTEEDFYPTWPVGKDIYFKTTSGTHEIQALNNNFIFNTGLYRARRIFGLMGFNQAGGSVNGSVRGTNLVDSIQESYYGFTAGGQACSNENCLPHLVKWNIITATRCSGNVSSANFEVDFNNFYHVFDYDPQYDEEWADTFSCAHTFGLENYRFNPHHADGCFFEVWHDSPLFENRVPWDSDLDGENDLIGPYQGLGRPYPTPTPTPTRTPGPPPPPGGGGSGGCFTPETPVTMSDGSQKLIKDVHVGDQVLAYDTRKGRTVAAKVRNVMRRMVNSYYLLNGNIQVTGEHPFYDPSTKQWIEVKNLRVGQSLRSVLGLNVRLNSIQEVKQATQVVNLTVARQHNFYAAGYLVHNKKFVGDLCFGPETPITLASGEQKRIDQIVPGDQVLAWNAESGEHKTGKVVRTTSRQTDTYYKVNGLRVTPEHPFYIEGKGWVAAKDLQLGDKQRSITGKPVSIARHSEIKERLKVHNFEVQDWHTYFAGGVLVHNWCPSDPGAPPDV